jgi:hypothetical protein
MPEMSVAIGKGFILLVAGMLLAACMDTDMPGRSFDGTAGAPTPPMAALADALLGHIQALSVDIGRRHMGLHENLTHAANYLESSLKAMGYEVHSQRWEEDGKPVRNVEVDIRGTTRPDEIILIGAHYDAAR